MRYFGKLMAFALLSLAAAACASTNADESETHYENVMVTTDADGNKTVATDGDALAVPGAVSTAEGSVHTQTFSLNVQCCAACNCTRNGCTCTGCSKC